MASLGLSHSDASRGDYVPLAETPATETPAAEAAAAEAPAAQSAATEAPATEKAAAEAPSAETPAAEAPAAAAAKEETPAAEISTLALRFSYVWYPIFIGMFLSPMNVNESKKIDDPGWRLYLYLAGVFMGIGYLLAGLVIAICRPLNLGTSRCTVVKNFILHTASKEESLEAYVYILLIPMGAMMANTHAKMLSARYGQGCSLGNETNITGCLMCQFAWLLIYSTWAAEIQQMVRNLRHDNVDHDQPLVEARAQTLQFSLNLTHLSSGIIVSVITLRATCWISAFSLYSDRDRFVEVYTGQTSESLDKVRDRVVEVACKQFDGPSERK